jgi:hypothetical protein
VSQKISQILFQLLLTITLFSLWAAFALLIVNKLFHKDLPGYTIGRICIWEFVALVIAALIAKFMINKWGNIRFREIDNKKVLIIDPKFGFYFLIYFLIGIIIGVWQFWIFSQNF